MIHIERKKIFKRYLKNEFIWDSIVIVPFLIHYFGVPYTDFVLLFRITRVSKMFENIEEATSIREKFAATLDLGRLIYLLIFSSHIIACVWHFVGI